MWVKLAMHWSFVLDGYMLVEKRGVTWGQYSCSVILTTVYIAQDYKLSALCKYCSELWGM